MTKEEEIALAWGFLFGVIASAIVAYATFIIYLNMNHGKVEHNEHNEQPKKKTYGA